MEDVNFSDDFCGFIQTSIAAVEVAEILLYLRRNAAASHAAREVVAGLKPGTAIAEADAEKHIEALRARDLVVLDAEKRARYQPGTDALRAHADTLAAAYSERPVTLIRVIYALRDAKIKTFADAFRIKR